MKGLRVNCSIKRGGFEIEFTLEKKESKRWLFEIYSSVNQALKSIKFYLRKL